MNTVALVDAPRVGTYTFHAGALEAREAALRQEIRELRRYGGDRERLYDLTARLASVQAQLHVLRQGEQGA